MRPCPDCGADRSKPITGPLSNPVDCMTCGRNCAPTPSSGARERAIAARLAAATPGPWAWANTCEKGYGANVGAGCFAEDDMDCKRPLSGDLTERTDDYYVDQPIATLDHQNAGPDAAFIAHAREDIEWLLSIAASAVPNAAPPAPRSE